VYVDENDSKFPNFQGYDWMDRVREYYADVDDMLFCPVTKRTLEDGAPATYAVISNKDGEPRGSYALNEWIYNQNSPGGGQNPQDYWKSVNHKNLANIPVMGDAAWRCDGQPNDTDRPPAYEGQPRTGVNKDEMRIVCLPRHGDGINVLFMDGSTRKVSLKGLWKLKWNRSFNTNVTSEWPQWMSGFRKR